MIWNVFGGNVGDMNNFLGPKMKKACILLAILAACAPKVNHNVKGAIPTSVAQSSAVTWSGASILYPSVLNDGGFASYDAGVELVDAGIQIQDSGIQLDDAGIQLQDAGFGKVDAGIELVDGGILIIDAGWIDAGASDAGQLEIDAGIQITDAGINITDGGNLLNDAGILIVDAGILIVDAGIDIFDAGIQINDAGFIGDSGYITPASDPIDLTGNLSVSIALPLSCQSGVQNLTAVLQASNDDVLFPVWLPNTIESAACADAGISDAGLFWDVTTNYGYVRVQILTNNSDGGAVVGRYLPKGKGQNGI